MKNLYLFGTRFAVLVLLASYCAMAAQNSLLNKDEKLHQILYFNPEVFPEVEEIKDNVIKIIKKLEKALKIPENVKELDSKELSRTEE